MDKIEYRTIIKYLFLKATQIEDEFDYTFWDSAPSFITVTFRAAKFKNGCKSLGEDQRRGLPKTPNY